MRTEARCIQIYMRCTILHDHQATHAYEYIWNDINTFVYEYFVHMPSRTCTWDHVSTRACCCLSDRDNHGSKVIKLKETLPGDGQMSFFEVNTRHALSTFWASFASLFSRQNDHSTTRRYPESGAGWACQNRHQLISWASFHRHMLPEWTFQASQAALQRKLHSNIAVQY